MAISFLFEDNKWSWTEVNTVVFDSNVTWKTEVPPDAIFQKTTEKDLKAVLDIMQIKYPSRGKDKLIQLVKDGWSGDVTQAVVPPKASKQDVITALAMAGVKTAFSTKLNKDAKISDRNHSRKELDALLANAKSGLPSFMIKGW